MPGSGRETAPAGIDWDRSDQAEPPRGDETWRRPRWPCDRDRRRKSRWRQRAESRRPRPPSKAARKIRRWFGPRAAARLRARRGRRRERARPASLHKNPEREPPPASKCTASNHPPKARYPIKPLTFMYKITPPEAKRRHHKRFDRNWKPLLV